MGTRFIKLNDDWNADAKAPEPAVTRSGNDVKLEFQLNPFLFRKLSKGDRVRFKTFPKGTSGILRFRNCWRYRLGETDGEGWYLGQCRFSRIAPAWGEFYEVQGDLKL